MLFGVWYCFKRGREERMKEEGVATPVPEILVEGATPDGTTTDHGEQNFGLPPPRAEAAPVKVETPPPAVESATLGKKNRKSWFK